MSDKTQQPTEQSVGSTLNSAPISAAPPPTHSPTSTPTAEPTLAAYAVMLRDAVVKISESAPTQARMILDQYLQRITPLESTKGDSLFPRGVVGKTHKHNKERVSDHDTLYGMVIWYIGNAILAYYASVADNKPSDTFKERVHQLQQIAKLTVAKYIVAGSYNTGFYLAERAK